MQSTPIVYVHDNTTGTKQQIVPVLRPISPLVGTVYRPTSPLTGPNYFGPKDSSDSDSFICISDPKKKLTQSEKVSLYNLTSKMGLYEYTV